MEFLRAVGKNKIIRGTWFHTNDHSPTSLDYFFYIIFERFFPAPIARPLTSSLRIKNN